MKKLYNLLTTLICLLTFGAGSAWGQVSGTVGISSFNETTKTPTAIEVNSIEGLTTAFLQGSGVSVMKDKARTFYYEGTGYSFSATVYQCRNAKTATTRETALSTENYWGFSVTIPEGYTLDISTLTMNAAVSNKIEGFLIVVDDDTENGTAGSVTSYNGKNFKSFAKTLSLNKEGLTGTHTFKCYWWNSSQQYFVPAEFSVQATLNPPAAEAPTFATDLESSYTIDTKSPVNLSVVAVGATSYQWYMCDDAEKTNAAAIDGATSPTYSFSSTVANTYYVYCEATNAHGSATSNVAEITVNEAPKSNECELTNIVLSNGFDMFIKDGVLTGFYLAGTEIPTVKSITLSESATYEISGNTLIVTAEDGITTKEFAYNVSAVEPLTDNDVHTMTADTPSWLKGGVWNTGRDAHEIYKNVDDPNNMRITEGKNRVYLFVDAGSAIRLTTNDQYTSARTIKVSRNGELLSSPTSFPKYADGGTIDIIADETAPCMIEIVNTSNGSAGIETVQLYNYPVVSYVCNDADVEGVVPASEKVSAATFTLPKYYRLYKEGYSLTAWSDGTEEYAPGASYTLNGDITFEPVFTANTKLLGAEATYVMFDLRANNGAPKFTTQNAVSLLVAKAENGIDVKMSIDATSGKFSVTDRGDYAQINTGSVIKVPALNGMTVTIDAWYDTYDFVINGETVDQDKKQTVYTYNGDDEELSITFGNSAYYNYIKIDYPEVIKSVNVQMSNLGISTFCPVYSDVEIPEGLTAYTASINEEQTLVTLKAVEGGKLPKGCGVVLCGDEGEYTFMPTTEAAVLDESNQMKGATEDITGLGRVFALGAGKDGKAIFGGWAGEVFPAGKAYLNVLVNEAVNPAPKVAIVIAGNGATGVQDALVSGMSAESNAYNLAGQKVGKDYKGIVVVNGRKLINK